MPLVHVHGVQNLLPIFFSGRCCRDMPCLLQLANNGRNVYSCRHVHVYDQHMLMYDAKHKRKRAGAMSWLMSSQRSRRGQLMARLLLQSCTNSWRRLRMKRVCWKSR